MAYKFLAAVFLILSVSTQSFTQSTDSLIIVNDTVIIKKDPVVVMKKVYVQEKRGYAFSTFIGLGYAGKWDLDNRPVETSDERGFTAESFNIAGSYFLNFSSISAGIGLQNMTGKFSSIYSYTDTVTYMHVDSVITSINISTPRGIVYTYDYDTTWRKRPETREKTVYAEQKLSVLQIPLQLGYPVYIRKICIIPGAGFTANIVIKRKELFKEAGFSGSMISKPIAFTPTGSLTTIIPLFKKVYFQTTVSCSGPLAQKAGPSISYPVLKAFAGISCIF
jgi:hypothetical protein